MVNSIINKIMDYFQISEWVGIILIVASIAIYYSSKKGGSFLPKMKSNNSASYGGFTSDITNLAKEGKVDPVIGRDDEILRVTQILTRRRKNNVILVGEPGVGKTAIVEGLALKIITGDVPAVLQNKRVLVLQVADLISGTKYRGEFEQRVKQLVDYIKSSGRSIILFIDEIHTIMQTKGSEGSVNISDILKPALARGELQVIGATTKKEYEEFITETGGGISISKEELEKFILNKNFSNYELVKGDINLTVPKYVSENPDLKISLLNIDTDIYEPAKTILEHLAPKVVVGGIIIFDDYGIFHGETQLADEYCEKHGYKLINFPFNKVPSYLIKE